MKKLLSIAMVLTLVFALASCGLTNVRGEIKDTSSQITSSQEPSTTENDFELGSVSGKVYENKYIGIGTELSGDFYFYTDEEIKQINNISYELAGEDYQELMKDANIVYDMYAQTPDFLSSVNVVMEKFNPLEMAAVNLKLSLESSIPTITSSYENLGYKNVQAEVATVEFAGKTRDVLNVTAELNGLTFYLCTVNMKAPSHVVNVTVGAFDKNAVDNIIKNFYAVN